MAEGQRIWGNKNAEKWTFKKSVAFFHEAIKLTQIKEYNEKIGEYYKFDFIGEIARELGSFKDIFSHLVRRFPQLQRLKNQLDTNVEQNCYANTKKGAIREATGIVNLKSNWKWTDRLDNTSNDKEIKGLTIKWGEDEIQV